MKEVNLTKYLIQKRGLEGSVTFILNFCVILHWENEENHFFITLSLAVSISSQWTAIPFQFCVLSTTPKHICMDEFLFLKKTELPSISINYVTYRSRSKFVNSKQSVSLFQYLLPDFSFFMCFLWVCIQCVWLYQRYNSWLAERE